MRKSRLLAGSVLAIVLVSAAAPVLALYTGVTVAGGASEISTLTLKLPGSDPVTAERGSAGGFGINTSQAVTPGFGTATITSNDGKTRTVAAFIDEGNKIRTYMPTGDCLIPGFCGWAGVDYSNLSPSTGTDGNQWGAQFAGLIPLGGIWNLQLGGSYRNISRSGGLGDVDSWAGHTALLFNAGNWRAGPVVGVQSNGTNYASTTTYNYGAFVEVFFPHVALSGKLGAFDSNRKYAYEGYYTGVSGSAFLSPKFALSASYDYAAFNGPYIPDETDLTATLEYKVSSETPISLIGGYTRTSFSGSNFTVDTFFIGLRVYCDDNGASTLEERHNTGTADWGAAFSPLIMRF